MSADLSLTPQVGESRLPQELVNCIIDLCQDDTRTLKKLSVVHHSWLSRSRKHLFRNVTVEYKMTWAFGTKSVLIPGIGEESLDKVLHNQQLWMSLFHAFVDFLTRAPKSITDSVQKLSLLGKDSFARGGENKTDWTAEEYEAWTISLTTDAVLTVLRLLPNLSELRLHLDLHQSSKTIPTDRFGLRTLSLNWCLASTDCLLLLLSLFPELQELRWAVWERTPQNTPLRLLTAPASLIKDLSAKLKKRGRMLRKLSRVVVRREPQQLHEAFLELIEAACDLGKDEERPAMNVDLCMALATKDDVVRYRRLFKTISHYVTRLTLRPTRTKDDVAIFRDLIAQDVGLSYCYRLRRLHIDVSIYWRLAVSICIEGILKDLFSAKRYDGPNNLKLVLSLDHTLAFTFDSEKTFSAVDEIVVGYKDHLREVDVAKGGEVPDEDQQVQATENMPKLVEAGLLRF